MNRRRFVGLSGAAIVGGLLGMTERLAGLTPGVGVRARARRPTGEALASFDLRVTFLGLCLLVPDPRYGRMHVLMPPTGPHTHGPGGTIDQHLVRLVYDTAHERPDAHQPDHQPTFVPLEDAVLELTALSEGNLDLTLPAEIVDLNPIVREQVRRERLGHDSSGKVRTRVTLDAGSVTAQNPGTRWRLGSHKVQHMAISIEWTIRGIPRDRLEWSVAGLNGQPGRPLPTLHPIGGEVRLFIYHTPPDELPPTTASWNLPSPGSPAEHFAAYYNVFDRPAAMPLPVFNDPGSSRIIHYTSTANANPRASRRRGSQVTCILASAEAESA